MNARPEMQFDLRDVDPDRLSQLSDEQFRWLMAQAVDLQAADRKENQLLYYEPASPEARKVHMSKARWMGIGAGNGAGKTDTCLADIIACCTGIIPTSCPEIAERFRGPISARIVVQSLSNTLHTVILPKLQWWRWDGMKPMGGDKGHWGWVPKLSLIDADWERSWSEKLRVLRMLCRDPENPDKVLGESFIQFCSHDQDPQDLASGNYEIVLHDEPTKWAIWAENKARTMRVNGRMMMAMTWPDDPAIPVDWIFDELYEPGCPGPNKSPEHEWIELSTRGNKNLDQRSVDINARSMDKAQRDTRILGLPIRFSNRIHPLFTDNQDWWSFADGRTVFPAKNDIGQDCCPETGSTDVVAFTHVRDAEPSRLFPTVFLLDPHPRKPHMFMWVQIDPSDDYCCVMEGDLDGSPDEVAELVRRTEDTYGLQIMLRLMDPNMGKQPSSAGRREMSWVDEFAEAGLTCDLASDSDVGRSRINEYLQPDEYTLRPRLTISNSCTTTIFQMKRYCWDEHKRAAERDLKQVAKAKNDDYPTMLKYLMNNMPMFRSLMDGPRVLQREGMRPGGGYGGRPRRG